VIWSAPSLDDTDIDQSSDVQMSESDDDTMTTSLILPSLQPPSNQVGLVPLINLWLCLL